MVQYAVHLMKHISAGIDLTASVLPVVHASLSYDNIGIGNVL
jgi:hypothetical protein